MKAWELQVGTGLEGLRQVERPSPALPAHGVRVRVRAVSLNYRDLLVQQRGARGELPRAIIPLSDGAGEVVEVGAAVTRFRPGARVVANFFPAWLDGPVSDGHHAYALGGGGTDGMFAEEVVLHEEAFLAIPEHLDYDEAATLPCAAVTAWHALFEATTTRPGHTVLVQGTGGVSLFALQLAKAAGARVILTSSSAQKRSRAEGMGAFATLDYRTMPEWGAAAHRLAGGQGVDVAIEVGGPATLDQSVAATRYGGTVSLIGVLTGFAGPINTYAIVHKGLRVAGIYVGSRRMFESLNAALSASLIRPVIDRVFAFGEAREAYAHLASGTHFGKVVIRVGD